MFGHGQNVVYLNIKERQRTTNFISRNEMTAEEMRKLESKIKFDPFYHKFQKKIEKKSPQNNYQESNENE